MFHARFEEGPLVAFHALMPSSTLSIQPEKGGTFVMRHESNEVDTAMIGAHQECLLSASPR